MSDAEDVNHQSSLAELADEQEECLCELVGDDRLGCFEHHEVSDS